MRSRILAALWLLIAVMPSGSVAWVNRKFAERSLTINGAVGGTIGIVTFELQCK